MEGDGHTVADVLLPRNFLHAVETVKLENQGVGGG